jgi:hypothetical protein
LAVSRLSFAVRPPGVSNAMYDKQKIRDTKLQMRRVLLEQWDPIGVMNEPYAQDEYDGYLGELYDLLSAGASEAEMVEYLNTVETVGMGGHSTDKAKLRSVVQALKHIPL